jgi:uncharacterized protein RhaS with RHS repeats
MAKVAGKGTVLQQTISMALTAVAQITDLEYSGAESQTWDSTTLDGGVFKTYDATGYSEPGTVTAGLFYDPALSGHQFITDQISTPADNAQTIIYADPGATEQAFTASGVSWGVTVAMDDGLRATATWQVDGDPGLPT